MDHVIVGPNFLSNLSAADRRRYNPESGSLQKSVSSRDFDSPSRPLCRKSFVDDTRDLHHGNVSEAGLPLTLFNTPHFRHFDLLSYRMSDIAPGTLHGTLA